MPVIFARHTQLRLRPSNSFERRPPLSDPFPEIAFVYGIVRSRVSSPHGDRLAFTPKLEHDVVARVVHLLALRCPPAIPRLVIAVIVFAI